MQSEREQQEQALGCTNRIRNIMLLCAAAGFPVASAFAAPITFNTALPVSQGEFIFRELVTIGKASDDTGGLGRDMTMVTTSSVVAFGVTPDLALFGILPVTFRKLKTTASTRRANGVGDARFVARYTIYKKNGIGKTTRIAPFIGLKAPTGDNKRSDTFGLLPPNLQPGTGSWDILGGIIATHASVDWNFDFQASYQANSKAGIIERGDVARADASFQYRLLPGKLSSNDKGYLYGVLETSLVHGERLRVSGLADTNTGGTTFSVVPGVQYATRRWIIEAAVQIPVIQDLNGTALKRDLTIQAGFRVNF